ncbi:hypothetical protein CHU98_g1952 [Xylaria longipes]|nr:hypothetical protein CHU98_g1952 [Xylaria longipes]
MERQERKLRRRKPKHNQTTATAAKNGSRICPICPQYLGNLNVSSCGRPLSVGSGGFVSPGPAAFVWGGL